MKYVVLLAMALLAGCAAAQFATSDPYVLKGDRAYDKLIADPCIWASRQLEEACPVSYETVNGIRCVRLQEASGDLDHDGEPELFLGNGPARCWQVVVFTPMKEGYRYLGTLAGSAFRVLPLDESGQPRMLVFEPCGGHHCYIKTYTHDGAKFACTASEEMHCGDGAPEENNRRLDELFFSDSAKDACLKWRKR